jgi:hypothetical protein
MAFQVTEVQKALKGASYPASGRELAELARTNGGDDALIEQLASQDEEFSGPDQVMKGLKGSLTGSDQS